MNGEVCYLLRVCDSAFRAGDVSALMAARRSLSVGIKKAKSTYALKIQSHFSSNDLRSMWKDIKCVTDYNKNDVQGPADPSLPDALNSFYARFEVSNTTLTTRMTLPPDEPPFKGHW